MSHSSKIDRCASPATPTPVRRKHENRPSSAESIPRVREGALPTLQHAELTGGTKRLAAKRSKSTPPASPTPPREKLGNESLLKRILKSPRRLSSVPTHQRVRSTESAMAEETSAARQIKQLTEAMDELKSENHQLRQQLQIVVAELQELKKKQDVDSRGQEWVTVVHGAPARAEEPITRVGRRTQQLTRAQRCKSMDIALQPNSSDASARSARRLPRSKDDSTATRPVMGKTRSSPSLLLKADVPISLRVREGATVRPNESVSPARTERAAKPVYSFRNDRLGMRNPGQQRADSPTSPTSPTYPLQIPTLRQVVNTVAAIERHTHNLDRARGGEKTHTSPRVDQDDAPHRVDD